MSETLPTDQFIRAISDYFENPPDENYDPHTHGVQIAETLSDVQLGELVPEVLKRLHKCVAISFLSGVFSTGTHSISPVALLDLVTVGRQVDTASAIVELLVCFFHLHPDDVASGLACRLALATDFEQQDRLAYGLWVLFNKETLLVQDNKLVGYLISSINHEIAEQLRRSDLSDYARNTLIACKRSGG